MSCGIDKKRSERSEIMIYSCEPRVIHTTLRGAMGFMSGDSGSSLTDVSNKWTPTTIDNLSKVSKIWPVSKGILEFSRRNMMGVVEKRS